jgi:hypothetical protein
MARPEEPEERRHRYRESRVIEVWCEEPSHAPVRLGSLKSVNVTHFEMWIVEGRHVQTQRLSPDKGPWDILALLDRVAERYRVRCPRCGFDVVAGDRLGPRPGIRYLWENEPGVSDGRQWHAALTTDRVLSTLADAGISRLTLAALGRMLSR